MAGGKETPRQKMIGMMYLVLTALLALNVSKQILDAFVAIESNIQKGTITQLDRGNTAVSDLNQALTECTKDESGLAKGAKIKRFLEIINKVDNETGKIIHEIDDLKLLILDKVGEDITPFKGDLQSEEAKDAIVWKEWSKNEPLRPAKLNLMAVQSKDNFDVPQFQLIGSEAENIPANSKGMEFWKHFKNYRNTLVDLTGTYKEGNSQFRIKSKDIVEFKDFADLEKKISKMLKSNKINKEDIEPLIGIYQELTKEEMAEHEGHDGKVHWMGRTFAHAPLVGALASLSSLQNEIMSARAKAVLMLKGKISTGQYSFNKILGMAYPETAVLSPGEEFQVSVFMAAFDSDKQPVVKPGQGTISETKDGMAILKMRAAGGGEMKISGQVGIADKMGTIKWMPYETKVQVATKGGSLEMPEFNLLYRGYGNKIIPSASGFVSTDISAPGCSKTPITFNGRKGYAINPGRGVTSVNITLTGKDAKGKSVNIGTYQYKVKSMPKPSVNVTTISKGGGRVTVALEGSVLVTNYTYKSIQVGEDYSGSGNIIPASALAKIRPGKKVGIMVTVVSSLTGETYQVPGYLTVTQ
jgi:gliding motility-associated protein GldM